MIPHETSKDIAFQAFCYSNNFKQVLCVQVDVDSGSQILYDS